MSSSIPDPVPPHATPEQLRHIINYWRIEASHNYGRWINAVDELNELRKSSFVTAVPSEDYEKLKAENERLNERLNYLEALIPRDAHHGGKIYDYADLQAENERQQNVIAKLFDQRGALRSENERLRRAGDGLFGIAYNAGPAEGRVEKLDAWRDAKEGTAK
jgi:hypothetical protein